LKVAGRDKKSFFNMENEGVGHVAKFPEPTSSAKFDSFVTRVFKIAGFSRISGPPDEPWSSPSKSCPVSPTPISYRVHTARTLTYLFARGQPTYV
jgi:hypothetical protein